MAVAGQSMFVDVELRPKPARVAIKTEDDARITIDGRLVATTPAPRSRSSPGKHFSRCCSRSRAVRQGARGRSRRRDDPDRAAREDVAPPRGAMGAGRRGRAARRGGDDGARRAVAQQQRQRRPRRDRDGQSARPATADHTTSLVCSRDRFVTYTWLLGGAAVADRRGRRLSVLLRYTHSGFGHRRSDRVDSEPVISGQFCPLGSGENSGYKPGDGFDG